MAKRRLRQGDIDMDLTPMIDVIFLLIIFFILAGRITNELRAEKITVPPTQTSEENDKEVDWSVVVIEAFGTTMREEGGSEPVNKIRINGGPWLTQKGLGDLTAYVQLREKMDQIYVTAPQQDSDPAANNGMILKKVQVEIRADMLAEYRIVQEILQVISDSVDPTNEMKPKQHANPAAAKPFVNVNFTTRKPDVK